MKAEKTINKKKKSPKVNIKKLKESIKELENSIKESKDKNTRLLAEFDNFKKRNLEDKRKLLKYDGLDFIILLLPILDDIDRTINLKELKTNKTLKNMLKSL